MLKGKLSLHKCMVSTKVGKVHITLGNIIIMPILDECATSIAFSFI